MSLESQKKKNKKAEEGRKITEELVAKKFLNRMKVTSLQFKMFTYGSSYGVKMKILDSGIVRFPNSFAMSCLCALVYLNEASVSSSAKQR